MARPLTPAETAERDLERELATEARAWADGLKAGSRAARDNERKRAAEASKGGRLKRKAYYPGSPNSWFSDMALVRAAAQPDPGFRPTGAAVEAARKRLASVEKRDISIGSDWPTLTATVPPFIADLWATSARAKARLPQILRSEPLPATGIVVQTGTLTSAGSAAARADLGAVSESSPTAALVEAPVAEISSMVDAGRILHGRVAGADEVIARESAEAHGPAADSQILYGDGNSPNLLGLASVSGITEVTYTDASPDQATCWANIMSAISQLTTALGDEPTHVVAHPRRIAWLANWKDTAGVLVAPELPFGMQFVPCGSIRTALGSGTNQDEIFILAAGELPFMAGELVIEVHEDVGSSTGAVRVASRQLCALLANRRPEAIARISGTGLTTPTFT